MDSNERRISDYIDRLNEEKKPDEHENPPDSPELNELFQTVRQIKSLKDPAMPEEGFPKQLGNAAKANARDDNHLSKTRKWTLLSGIAGMAAILVLILNLLGPFGNKQIVEAMEAAFQDVKAYHGMLEIQETNGSGQSITQAKMEVWADQDGHYFLKELEGSQKGLITANNGQKKWQVQPTQKQVHVFPAFPDAYRFTFELGKEVENAKSSVSTKVIGDGKVSGREATIVEITPKGGEPYRMWIDKETKLPLQKQLAMHNNIQYKMTYTKLEFTDTIPKGLIAYQVPKGFKEINDHPEQLINDLNEAKAAIGFTPIARETAPSGYSQESMAVVPDQGLFKITYSTTDKKKRIIVIQSKSAGEWKTAPNAILGKVNQNPAEIQSPVFDDLGVLGGGQYAGMTDIRSIRWQEDGYEFAVVGNVPVDELARFTKNLTKGPIEIPSPEDQSLGNPQVAVPYDLTVEENDQKNADAGSSPWKLDPAFAAQVFVSLKMSPGGITGDYPIAQDELTITKNNGVETIIEVNNDHSPIKRVYLKRLIRQDSTGIWTVVGYDPK